MFRIAAVFAGLWLAVAGASQAATIVNFGGSPFQGSSLTLLDVVGDIDLNVVPSIAFGSYPGATVTRNVDGLGVGAERCFLADGIPACIDIDPNDELDNQGEDTPIYSQSQRLTFTFSAPVKLVSLGFSRFDYIDFLDGGGFDDRDDYRIAIDGIEVLNGPFLDNPYLFGGVEVMSFSVEARFADNELDFPADFDSFRVQSLTIATTALPAAVPLPAAGLLLGAALCGLALARRRKTA